MVRFLVAVNDLGRQAVEVAHHISDILSSWDEVDAAFELAYGEDRYDPYLALSIDAYLSAPIRDPDQRHGAFSEAGAFESAILGNKDRFLAGDLPVRIEYKLTSRFMELVRAAQEGRCLLRAARTFAFYRLSHGEPLFVRNDWFGAARDSISSLPSSFWTSVLQVQIATLDHLLSDLQAATARQDPFYFTVASGRFASQVVAVLFALNRMFEPSPRLMQSYVGQIPDVPDSFKGNLEHFCRADAVITMDQKTEIAALMARELSALAE